jgi:hypothetical protein
LIKKYKDPRLFSLIALRQASPVSPAIGIGLKVPSRPTTGRVIVLISSAIGPEPESQKLVGGPFEMLSLVAGGIGESFGGDQALF